MAKYVCTKRIFGAKGECFEVDQEVDSDKPLPQSHFQKASGGGDKKLEVATPKKDQYSKQ